MPGNSGLAASMGRQIQDTAAGCKTAFVVPAFEWAQGAHHREVASKEELRLLYRRGEILPFRFRESVLSHNDTDFDRWFDAGASAAYAIDLGSASDLFEPYVAIDRSCSPPAYSDGFTGYGMNKVAFTYALYLAGFDLRVLTNAWVVHLPHEASDTAMSFLNDPDVRIANRLKRFEFLCPAGGR